VKNSYKLKLTY